MNLQSIPEKEAQIGRIKAFVETLPDGEDVSWLRVESECEIKMDYAGRALVRTALKRLRRPYAAVRGTGFQLSAPTNALAIMKGRFTRIDSAVRKADRTREHLSGRHLAQMTTGDQQKMLTLAGFFGAVRAFASEAGNRILK